jgi:hypothetical protein
VGQRGRPPSPASLARSATSRASRQAPGPHGAHQITLEDISCHATCLAKPGAQRAPGHCDRSRDEWLRELSEIKWRDSTAPRRSTGRGGAAEGAPALGRRARLRRCRAIQRGGNSRTGEGPAHTHPLPSRTDWTRLVPRPVLNGHVSSPPPLMGREHVGGGSRGKSREPTPGPCARSR